MKLVLAKSPYKHYLDEDPRLKSWLENVERGSVTTASEYIRRIGHVCDAFRVTPKQLGKMSEKTAGDFLLKVVSHFENKGSAGTNIKGYSRGLKSWWAFNDIQVKKKVNIRGSTDYTRYENERVPTTVELGRIFSVANLKAKVCCSLVAFSGCRIEVLGNYLGDDGLKVSDFPEMTISNRKVEFEKIPTILKVRKRLSKAGNQYYSFLPDEACQYLKQYLELRIENREGIAQDSPIVTAERFNPRKIGQHIRTTNIGDAMRKAIREAGFDWRPYVFRRYFDTRVMQAENEGLVIRDWREYWMGRKGDIEFVYTLNKGLTDDLVEQMRESYAKVADKFLVTNSRKASISREEILSTMNKRFLTIAGYSEEELLEFGDLSKLSDSQLEQLLSGKSKEALGVKSNNNQKVIPLRETKKWIEQGWKYERDLPAEVIGGEPGAIISLPAQGIARNL